MAIYFEVLRDGGKCSARANGADPLAVGSRVRFGGTKYGLSNDSGHFGHSLAAQHLFRAADYGAVFGFWSDFIEPTAVCEGQSFLSLNTYDRARFTFGFGQFAVHVADHDFIRWFRDMLGRPEADDYFPNLEVRNGRICKIETGKAIPLESADSTGPLQLYLNPTLEAVEDDEIVAAAKLLHWTIHHPEVKLLQVQHMVNTARALVREADKRLGLDGKTADICAVIFDIRHQGRGTYAEMQAALLKSKPFDALLQVGADDQAGRVANLKSAMKSRQAALAARRWSRQRGDFV
ncbi:hypothetical protein [Zavarzinia compransoris]|uniref:Uncharacterized protein n=1 Tax=Zavarzinia compransoris TaxID=1264899 RepID=A0A317DVM8_9PROT|nr:hypothetical protein [Zavarzinia compransoris]PWR18738.1 hypothetical protein DKG75_17280 [Zavarzinia compransoris]TDP48721.1 hypothetical protein DES42_10177 [Zavarzinia compransoris]